jgi:hypothetical protein
MFTALSVTSAWAFQPISKKPSSALLRYGYISVPMEGAEFRIRALLARTGSVTYSNASLVNKRQIRLLTSVPDLDSEPDPAKTCGSGKSGSGFESGTLLLTSILKSSNK